MVRIQVAQPFSQDSQENCGNPTASRQPNNQEPGFAFVNEAEKALEFREMVAAGLREDLARNEVGRARPLIASLAEDIAIDFEPGSYDERLVGRAVLRSMIAACATIKPKSLTNRQAHRNN